MKKVSIYCDHCGKELNETTDYIDLELDVGQPEFIKCDLCKECKDKLIEITKNFINK